MGKSLYAAAIELLKALQKEAATLRSTAGVTPAQLEEMEEKLRAQSKLTAELEDQEKQPRKGDLPKGLFASLKESLIDNAPQVKGRDGKFTPEPQWVERVNALKVEDCEIASSKGDVYVINAGALGLRKVTL